MVRAFSGIQPSGDLHLGNFLGAVRRWVDSQHDTDAIFCVVDLHALTSQRAPGELAAGTLDLAALLLACGLDPDACTLFVQSHIPQHTGLTWLMECTASYGELGRMTQFKEKAARAAKGDTGFIPASLFTYPALQAADILLYDTDVVPVGDDQRQHLELARDIAERFNARYGDTLVVPEHVIPPVGARIMDLQTPTDKMSKSVESPQGTILVLDDPKTIERKIKRAVTDTDNEVRFDVAGKPGVSNLLSILGACTGADPEALADDYAMYGPLKADTADAVISLLSPIQARYQDLIADQDHVRAALSTGATKAGVIAAATLDRCHAAVGLLPPG